MELQNPINNQHMVDGLNRIIETSGTLASKCDYLAKKTRGSEAREFLRRVRDIHSGHITMLSDSVRFLGGLPSRQKKSRLAELSTRPFTTIDSVHRSEIEKLNIVLDDITGGTQTQCPLQLKLEPPLLIGPVQSQQFLHRSGLLSLALRLDALPDKLNNTGPSGT